MQKQAAPNLGAITVEAGHRRRAEGIDRVLQSRARRGVGRVAHGSAPGLGGSSSGLIHGMRAHAFIYNAVHSAEDYGTITTYLRMQGVVPPSTALHPPAPARGGPEALGADRQRYDGNLNAINSPEYPAPLTATTMYCRPFSM